MSTQLSEDSRVWIYQAVRPFSEEEIKTIQAKTSGFVQSWTSHNKQVNADFEIRYNRFIILMLDESHVTAGGCSIDSSVHFIQSLEKEFGNKLTDRMNFAYKHDSRVESVSKMEFEKLLSQGRINDHTIVFNNLIGTKKELDTNWEIPFSKSWHKQYFQVKI